MVEMNVEAGDIFSGFFLSKVPVKTPAMGRILNKKCGEIKVFFKNYLSAISLEFYTISCYNIL